MDMERGALKMHLQDQLVTCPKYYRGRESSCVPLSDANIGPVTRVADSKTRIHNTDHLPKTYAAKIR